MKTTQQQPIPPYHHYHQNNNNNHHHNDNKYHNATHLSQQQQFHQHDDNNHQQQQQQSMGHRHHTHSPTHSRHHHHHHHNPRQHEKYHYIEQAWDNLLMQADFLRFSSQTKQAVELLSFVLNASQFRYHKALYRASLFYLEVGDRVHCVRYCKLAIQSVCETLLYYYELEVDDHHNNNNINDNNNNNNHTSNSTNNNNNNLHHHQSSVSLNEVRSQLEYWLIVLYGYYKELVKEVMDAERLYRRAIEYAKQHRINAVDAYFNLSHTLCHMGMFQDAIHMFKLAKGLFSHVNSTMKNYWDGLCLFNIGTCYRALQQEAKALFSFDRALELFPTHSQSHFHRRHIYLHMENYEKVYEDCRYVLINQSAVDSTTGKTVSPSLSSSSSSSSSSLPQVVATELVMRTLTDEADALFAQGNFQQSYRVYCHIQRQYPSFYYPYICIAYHLFQLGQPGEALAQVNRGLRLVQSDHQAVISLVGCKRDLLVQLGAEFNEERKQTLALIERLKDGYLDRID